MWDRRWKPTDSRPSTSPDMKLLGPRPASGVTPERGSADDAVARDHQRQRTCGTCIGNNAGRNLLIDRILQAADLQIAFGLASRNSANHFPDASTARTHCLPRISTQKSVKARTLAGGCLRDGWKANSGNRSPCQRGKRSMSAPLASNSLTPQPMTCAMPVPATHSSNMDLGSAKVSGPLV